MKPDPHYCTWRKLHWLQPFENLFFRLQALPYKIAGSFAATYTVGELGCGYIYLLSFFVSYRDIMSLFPSTGWCWRINLHYWNIKRTALQSLVVIILGFGNIAQQRLLQRNRRWFVTQFPCHYRPAGTLLRRLRRLVSVHQWLCIKWRYRSKAVCVYQTHEQDSVIRLCK